MGAERMLAYVGCRTTKERNARGEGISVYEVPADGGRWQPRQLLPGLVNPSFLAFGPERRMLYAVHGDSSEISAFAVDAAEGTLRFVNQVGTNGKNPVHLALMGPDRRFIVVANHLTTGPHVSSLAVIALRPDGSLGDMTDHLPISGKPGPHRSEQPFAKPHQCQPDPSGSFIAVPDKGLDVTTCYRLTTGGKLEQAPGAPAPSREGEGPRHIAFHPARPFAYVVNELSSTLTACRFDRASGALAPFQVISCLPDSFTGFSRASEIEMSPDGRFVYASNRGHESIGVFAVDQDSGRLDPRGWTEIAGRTPRFFALAPDGRALFVANEDSDTILRYTRDAADGLLSRPFEVARTGSPTCILFAPQRAR